MLCPITKEIYPNFGNSFCSSCSYLMLVRRFPNENIMNVLVLNSVKKFEFALAIELLQRMRHLNVPVKEDLLDILEKARIVIKKKFIEIESEPSDTILTKKEERVRDEMKLFLMEYKHWLKTSNVELKEHPWAQFGYSEKGKVVARQS
ncbi:hypothetical protein Avbf_06467 [Armadillidium vulgare]|nr:hypothetical protein Avbf_06467 [Armadillidium vulgare]